MWHEMATTRRFFSIGWSGVPPYALPKLGIFYSPEGDGNEIPDEIGVPKSGEPSAFQVKRWM